MARILLAWELGGGLGHLLPLRGLADQLAQRGHQVWVAARDPVKLHEVFAGSSHSLLAAPHFAGVSIHPGQLSSLADVIWFDSGGHDPRVFSALLRSWRNLLESLHIDLLVADAAPAALAASAGLLPAIVYDVGFHAADAAAWTIFRDWEKVDLAAAQRRSDGLLQHLNQARSALGQTAVDQLSEGFVADRTLLRNVPDLDFRGERAPVAHIGAPLTPGATPHWPTGAAQQRILVYLRGNYAHLDRLIGALARLEHTSALVFHDAPTTAKLPRHPQLAYFSAPIDLALALPQTDLVICHGGMLQIQSTCHGKPTLVLPMQAEQFLQGRQAQRAGVALMLSPAERPDFLSAIRRLLGEPQFVAAAQALAQRQQQRCADPMAALLEQVDNLLHR